MLFLGGEEDSASAVRRKIAQCRAAVRMHQLSGLGEQVRHFSLEMHFPDDPNADGHERCRARSLGLFLGGEEDSAFAASRKVAQRREAVQMS